MLRTRKFATILLLGTLVGGVVVAVAFGQADPGDEQTAQPLPAAPSQSRIPSRPLSPWVAAQKSKHAENFYKSVWGVDKLEVRETASGSLLRFSYRVTDADRAKELNEERATPYLIDEKTGAVLRVPAMPKVGLLRQTADPTNGREYWMVFSNKRNFVKPGTRVDIVIGKFRANGLLVQ